jgi:hypothetical protein
VNRLFRTLLLNGLLVGLSGLFACGLGEVAVRVAVPQQLIIRRADIYQAVDSLGWRHQPNIVTTINSGEREVTLATDPRSLRIAPGTTRVPDARKVLILGDSFMEAIQVEHDSSTAGMLEAALRTSLPDPTLETWNAGVGGWSPEQYRLRAEALLRETQFSAALVAVYLGNDIMQWRTAAYKPRTPTDLHTLRFPRRLSTSEFVDALAYPVNDFLEERSHLFVLVKSRLETLRMRMGLTAAYFPPDFNKSVAADGRWANTATILEEIAAAARKTGVEPLFVLLPAPYQIDPALMMQYARGFGLDTASIDAEQPNRLLAAEMTARGLRHVDVLPAFREAQQAGTQLYGKVDQHFTAAGHALLVAQVLPLLTEQLSPVSASTPATKR